MQGETQGMMSKRPHDKHYRTHTHIHKGKQGNSTQEGDTAEPKKHDKTGRTQTEYTDIRHRPSK